MIISQFQGVVGERIVVDGILKGIPIPVDMLPPAVRRFSSMGRRCDFP